MSDFEKDYGIKEDEKTVEFHKSRRMFYIKDDELVIAEPKLPYSHAKWFEKIGLMSEADKSFMEKATRGMVDKEGDVYFYVGFNFEINENVKEEGLRHLSKLNKELKLNPDAKVYGGQEQNLESGKWNGKEYYGTVEELTGQNE